MTARPRAAGGLESCPGDSRFRGNDGATEGGRRTGILPGRPPASPAPGRRSVPEAVAPAMPAGATSRSSRRAGRPVAAVLRRLGTAPPADGAAWERGRPARMDNLGTRASRPHGQPGSAGVSPAWTTWERGRLARMDNLGARASRPQRTEGPRIDERAGRPRSQGSRPTDRDRPASMRAGRPRSQVRPQVHAPSPRRRNASSTGSAERRSSSTGQCSLTAWRSRSRSSSLAGLSTTISPWTCR